MKETILTVGAAGKFTGLVISALGKSACVRGLVRNANDAATASSNAAKDIADGDLDDAASVAGALKGATPTSPIPIRSIASVRIHRSTNPTL